MSKRNLYIIGAGKFGRELESWLEHVPDEERDWELKGFLDIAYPKGKLPFPSDYEVLGDESTYPLSKDDYVLISASKPSIREKIYHSLKDKVSFLTFISPKATVGKFNQIAEGTIICPHVVITTNVKLGKFTVVNIGSQIGHDVEIGDFTSLMANVDLGGQCKIGARCYLGTHSVIVPERKLADDITIGAGTTIIRNYSRSHITLFGNPPKVV